MLKVTNKASRRTCGVTQRSPKPAVVQMMERGETPGFWRPMPTDAQREAGCVAHGGVFAAWRELAFAMAGSGACEDHQAAVEMAYFVGASVTGKNSVNCNDAEPPGSSTRSVLRMFS
jgi:hypothetical protein